MKKFLLITTGLLFILKPGFTQDADLSNLDIISIEDKTSQKPYDFEPLKELLSDKRIVLLGEQSHGDGATFKAKVELIDFLHSELGFDMVAFESPMYGIYKANRLSEDLKNIRELLKESIFGIWSDTKQFQQLLDYKISTTNSKHPLVFAGFDFLERFLFEEYFFDDIKTVFNEKRLLLNDSTIEILKETFFGGSDYIANNQVDSINFYVAVEKVKSGFKRCDQNDENIQILQQSFLSYLADVEWGAEMIKGVEYKVQNPRDLQMAKNLIFLSELYPDKKIIGWGASYHFANEVDKYRNTDLTVKFMKIMAKQQKDEIENKEYDLDDNLGGAIPMGKILKSHFGDQLYSVAFSSFEGAYGMVGDESLTIVTPPKGSVEYELNATNHEFAFVDYSQIKSGMFYSSVLGNLPILAPWQDIFDGLLYIKTAYPPDFISYKEADLDEFLNKKNIQLKGRVIDAKSKQGIPYAHIAIENTSTGTVTNDAGYFTFNFNNRDSLEGQILYSSVGYKSLKIPLIDKRLLQDSLLVSLVQETKMLDEIIISEKFLSAKQIVKKARKSIEDNYFQNPFNQEVFCRVKEKAADSLTFKEEATMLTYYDIGFKGTVNPYKHIFGQILQFRNVTQNPYKDGWGGVGGMILVYSHDIILDKNNVLYKTAAYNLELTNITKYDDDEVYEITFTNKRPSAYTTGYGYPAPVSSIGKLYISSESFAILRYEHCIERKPYKPKKNNPYRSENVKYKLIQTFKRYNDRYFIHHTKHVFLYDKINLKTLESTHHTKSMDILSSEIYTEEVIPLEKPIAHIKAGMKVVEDPEFWNNHNIVLEDNDELDICNTK